MELTEVSYEVQACRPPEHRESSFCYEKEIPEAAESLSLGGAACGASKINMIAGGDHTLQYVIADVLRLLFGLYLIPGGSGT